MSNISEYSHNYSHNGVNYLLSFLYYRKDINYIYIYRILHGTLNSASTSFLVDIIENLAFNEDGRLLFPDFPPSLSIYQTFMIFSEMSRLSSVKDSILLSSQTIIYIPAVCTVQNQSKSISNGNFHQFNK